MLRNLPGQFDVLTVKPKNILVDLIGVVYDSIEMDSALSYDGLNVGNELQIREGWPIALTAAKRGVPVKRSQLTAPVANSVLIPVRNAAAFRAGDTSLTIGANLNATIVSVNYGNNTLTIAAAITANNNDPVFVAGQDVPFGFLNQMIDFRQPPFGVPANQRAQIVTAGSIQEAALLGDWAAIRAALLAVDPGWARFRFSTDFNR